MLAATILFIATNAGLIGISRLSWSLAEHRQLPAIFARLHPRYRTPWFTIVFFSVLAGLLLIPGKTDFLGNLYSFGAMLSFTTAHVAVIALRDQGARPRAALPDAVERPHPRAPDPDHRGARRDRHVRRLGLGGRAARRGAHVGIGWMVVGLVGYVLYRRRQGLDPRAQHRIERPSARRSSSSSSSYRSALVPIFGTDVRRARAARRGQAGRRGRRRSRRVYVLQVPQPAVARRRARGGGGARAQRARERAACRARSAGSRCAPA